MDIILIIIGVVCGVVGLLGTLIPILPGTIISYAGLLCVALTEDSTIGGFKLTLWAIIALSVIVLDYILPALFSKRYGGTKTGSIGATVGTMLGLFFGPLGLILGPFVGAVAGEVIAEQLSFKQALRVGFGSMLSFVAGTLFKFVVGAFMLYYIIIDII